MHLWTWLFLAGAVQAGELRQLHAPEARASSWQNGEWLKGGDSFHPTYVLDDDRSTAWVEGVEGPGLTERLVIPVSRLRSADRVQVRIRSGNQKDPASLQANPAPRLVRVELLDRGRPVADRQVELARNMGWQEVMIKPPAGSGFSAVAIQILSVWAGPTNDTAISDVEVFVDSEVAYNAKLENARRGSAVASLAAWRADTREFVQRPPDDHPFAFDGYVGSHEEVEPGTLGSSFQKWEQKLQAMAKNDAWYGMQVAKPVVVAPGAYELDAFADLLVPANLTFFETDKKMDPQRRVDDSYHQVRTSNNHVRFEGDRVDQVFFTRTEVYEERGTSETKERYLVAYDADGRIAAVFASGKQIHDGDTAHGAKVQTLWTFDLGRKGRIVSYTMVKRYGGEGKNPFAYKMTYTRRKDPT